MNKLWKYDLNCRRMGFLHALFVETEEEVNKYIGKEVYFGEVLGKHSEIIADFEMSDLKVIIDNQEVIDKLVEAFGDKDLMGMNPITILKEQEAK